MASSRSLAIVIVVLLAGILITSTLAALYLYQYDQAEANASTYLNELKQSSAAGAKGLLGTTSIVIDFGNGTRQWYNGTAVQPGWNVYLVTVLVTRGHLNDSWYPQYGEHLVNGIEGLQNSGKAAWFLFSYNSTSRWQPASLGADEVLASNGTVFGWGYCGVTSSYSPACSEP